MRLKYYNRLDMNELERILHVEDEPDIQAITKLALESFGGFSVKTCGSGREAIDQAPEFRPDLILLDVMMQDMGGPTVFQELRRIPQIADTPILFMTAKAQAREIEKFKGLGAIDVITKPFDPMTISDQIQNIWKRYHDA